MGQTNSKKEKRSTQKSLRKAKIDIKKVNKDHGTSAPIKPNPAITAKVMDIDGARAKRHSRFADRTLGSSPFLSFPQCWPRVDVSSTSGDWLIEVTETSNTAFKFRDTLPIAPQLNIPTFDANANSGANFRDTTASSSAPIPSSPPPIHSSTRHLGNTMTNTNYKEGDMDKLRGGFSSMELQAPEDTYNVNNIQISNPSFTGLAPGVSDDGDEEPRLSRLPLNSAPEGQYEAYDGPDQEYINYLFAVVANITDELAKIPTANGKIAFRMKTLKDILDARKTVIHDCLSFIHPDFPTIETDWHIHDMVMNFASRPICPWSYLRDLVTSNEFRILAIQLEQNVIWLVETFNRIITCRGKINNGEELCKKVAEILILNLQPSLRMENSAIPRVDHVLEKIDSFVDPACFSPDEDEPLELAEARGLWKKFYFIEKVAAMDVANKNAIFDSSHGAINPEDGDDRIPYFFALEERYLKEVASFQFQGEDDDMALVFTSKTFSAIADYFESDIDDFLVKLNILGATCRKKVLIMVVFEWLVRNSGLQSVRTFIAEADGANGAAADAANLAVLFGPATDDEIEDAFRLVAAGGLQHGNQETDTDGDQMMEA